MLNCYRCRWETDNRSSQFIPYRLGYCTDQLFCLQAVHLQYMRCTCDTTFLSVWKCMRGNRLPRSARSTPPPPFFARSGTILKTDRWANSAALKRETGRETNKQSVRQAGRPTGIHELRGSEVNSLTAVCSALTGGGFIMLGNNTASSPQWIWICCIPANTEHDSAQYSHTVPESDSNLYVNVMETFLSLVCEKPDLSKIIRYLCNNNFSG